MKDRYDDDAEFDQAMRQQLNSLPVPHTAMVVAPRRAFLRMGIAAMGLASVSMAGWLAWQYEETPELVRLAFAHAKDEAGLRGVLVTDLATVQLALGNPVPGVLQLCKNCKVGGYQAWHLNSYLDDVGYVQVFLFRGLVSKMNSRGRWLNGHWQWLNGKQGFLTLVLSDQLVAVESVVRTLRG